MAVTGTVTETATGTQTDTQASVTGARYGRFKAFVTYAPVLWIVAVLTLVSGVIALGHGLSFAGWMTAWMAGGLVLFSLFKLFDIRAFAQDFQKYDLIAARSRAYALAYPFIELGLGCLLIAGIAPLAVNLVIVFVFGVGAAGVLGSLRAGENLQCACVGRLFDLPLSRVALVEDLAMAVMGLLMVFRLLL